MENIAREEVRELCSRIRSCRTDSQLTVAQVKYGSAPSHTRSGSFLGETEIHIILLCTACSITSREEGSRVRCLLFMTMRVGCCMFEQALDVLLSNGAVPKHVILYSMLHSLTVHAESHTLEAATTSGTPR